MNCPSCEGENREGAKFCNECGAPLPLRCPSCGAENLGGAKFCSECGTALAGGEKAKGVKGEKERDSGLRTADSGLSSGERRQLTVMFCDLVGSTALSGQLDPEVVQQMVTKTDGVPLFVEEVTKTVLESGLHVGATGRSPHSHQANFSSVTASNS